MKDHLRGRIHRYLLRMNNRELREFGALAFACLRAQRRVWQWWTEYEALPLVLG